MPELRSAEKTKVSTRIGIMQGRLLPPEPGRFQAFPRERWREEFALAAQVPIHYIEWIHDLYGADVNPLTNDMAALRERSASTGIGTFALCADYFMDLPFVRCTPADCAEREAFLHRFIDLAHQAGIERIVLPFVDASAIKTPEDAERVVRVLHNALPLAEERGVELHLETALGPASFARLLDRIPSRFCKANYDSGNSSSLGYKPQEEFAAYGARIGSIHIKDRVLGGGTVPLGTGHADLPAVFNEMARVGYKGDITLQVARSEPGNELAWIRENVAFVARHWKIG